METLQEIQAPIKSHLSTFEKKFRTSLQSPVPLLSTITHYIIKRKGKQMRPAFVFLSADICGQVNEATHIAASLVELLHTATLVHDDVVDDAHQRRGMFSINALWKNKVAVLIGDYLLSKGMLLALEDEQFRLLKIVSNAVKEMSEGELLQIEKARHLDIEEDIYFEIIRKKTASLIAAACACGAASVTEDREQIDRMHRLGEKIGIAFQLKDDLFDYGKFDHTGKQSGTDLKEKKMTLPFIYMLSQVSYLEQRKYINMVKNNHGDKRTIAELIQRVHQSGGIEYATKKMEHYCTSALDDLSALPDGPSKAALGKLISYTVDRTN